jgi:hypothetical protein
VDEIPPCRSYYGAGLALDDLASAGNNKKLVARGASAKGRNCTPSRQLRNLTPPVAANLYEPRQWRTDDDDKRDAEAAEAERLRDEGRLIEHEARRPEPSN